MNDWNSTKRWAKAYVDDKDDPWLQMDVDLSPGGTEEGLNDQFSDLARHAGHVQEVHQLVTAAHQPNSKSTR